jgi:hypothetical protein
MIAAKITRPASATLWGAFAGRKATICGPGQADDGKERLFGCARSLLISIKQWSAADSPGGQ